MKKIISSVLSTAMVLSCVTTIVSADEPVAASSTVYTIDASAKKVSKVAPLTTVAKFKSNITDDETIEVINVDGTVMPDNAYATENVFAKIDGSLYKISVEYPYDPINTYGRNYRADGDVLFEKASASFNSTVSGQAVRQNSGFAYATSGYKLGDVSGTAPTLNAGARTLITKQTEDGHPVYVIQNNAPRYAFLRSHYSSASYESQQQSALTDVTLGKVSVTTVTFKADKIGNVSLHHNAAGYATSFSGDGDMGRFTYSDNGGYLPNAVHFTEEGTIKIGGTYANGATATSRTPKHETGIKWEANKEYTVSVVQKLRDGDARNANVYGIYVNGEKIFPKGNEVSPNSQFAYISSKGAYSMNTRGSDYKYHGGISAVLVGAAPKEAGDDIKVSFSDVKVYTIDAASLYTGDIDSELALENAEEVEVDGTVINVYTEETVESLRAKYPDYAIAVYNADGTQPAATDNLATGMSAKVVSDNGVQVKLYSISATKKINQTEPESEVYTVDTENKTISKVKPLTKVSDFLANFENGSLMQVVNIDGSVMADDAYATENVTLVAPNGDNYSIVVSYPYSPIQNDGAALADGTSLYKNTATGVNDDETTGSGFTKVQVYDKFGYGSDNASLENTDTQVVKGTKKTVNGEAVYVMENDSNKYAYIRSHYTESANNSTDLYTKTRVDYNPGKIVTTVEFEADKLGNISVFNNTPVRSKSAGKLSKGDSGVDGLIYAAELPYAPNSVHFLEDGTVKLGGMYSNYSVAYRTPVQETDFTWEPGKKYTVSIVQKYTYGGREAYVYGVYVNGTQIFPNAKTVSYDGGRVALQTDGSFKIGTKEDEIRHGGGLSSIMIGTAPKTADENLTVTLSDVKVYNVAAYNAAMDKDIILTSNTSKVVIDNDNALISCMGSFDASSIATDAKVKVDGNSLKAVSADGLVSKTYTIVSEEVRTSFLDGENGPKINSLSEAGNSVCFKAEVDANSLLDGTNAAVVIAVYDKTTKLLKDCVIAEGVKNADEVTTYKAVIDISAYNKNDIEICGFAWDGFKNMEPLSAKAELK